MQIRRNLSRSVRLRLLLLIVLLTLAIASVAVTIEITIPSTKTVFVPQLVNYPRSKATRALRQLSLNVIVKYQPFTTLKGKPAGTVLLESPQAGTKVNVGTRVTLVVQQ